MIHKFLLFPQIKKKSDKFYRTGRRSGRSGHETWAVMQNRIKIVTRRPSEASCPRRDKMAARCRRSSLPKSRQSSSGGGWLRLRATTSRRHFAWFRPLRPALGCPCRAGCDGCRPEDPEVELWSRRGPRPAAPIGLKPWL